MKCLSPEEVSSWLRNVGQIEDPYFGETAPEHAVAFRAPNKYPAVECFVRCFLDRIIKSGELLVVVTDDEPSQPCQEFVSDAIRHLIGEERSISKAPGYKIDFADREKAIGIFSMTTCFGWKCYLYADHDALSLYNWEGEIFDVWTNSEVKMRETLESIKYFQLQVIPDNQPNA